MLDVFTWPVGRDADDQRSDPLAPIAPIAAYVTAATASAAVVWRSSSKSRAARCNRCCPARTAHRCWSGDASGRKLTARGAGGPIARTPRTGAHGLAHVGLADAHGGRLRGDDRLWVPDLSTPRDGVGAVGVVAVCAVRRCSLALTAVYGFARSLSLVIAWWLDRRGRPRPDWGAVGARRSPLARSLAPFAVCTYLAVSRSLSLTAALYRGELERNRLAVSRG